MEGKAKFKGPAIVYRYHRVHSNNMEEYLEERRLIVGAVVLEEFRKFLFAKTGLEASGGIGLNKLQAKLACPLHKPGGMTILLPSGMSSVKGCQILKKV